MFSLNVIAWKLYKAAKIHVVTSISIIAVAICLIVTMATYIHNAKANLDANIEALYGEMDILAGFDYGKGQFVSNELYERIESLPEVERISPVSLEMTQIEQLSNVYTLGVENDALVKSRYHFEQNLSAETMIISELLANSLVASVGDEIRLNGKAYTLIEILPTPMGAEPFLMALVHHDVLKQEDVKSLFMLIQTSEVETIASTLQAFDEGLRIDIVDDDDFVKMNVQSLLIFVVVLSIFILLITGLLLMSTMQLVFTKLKEQLMILRSLGASTYQIVKLVRMQLLMIVCAGLVVGVLLSILTIQLALPKFIEWIQLPAATTELSITLMMLIVIAIGLILTGYMLLQMNKAMHILPLQMVNDREQRTFELSKWKGIVVGIVTVIALLFMLVGQVDGSGDKGAAQILVGSLLLALVVLYLIPFAFQWILKGALQPIRMIFGKEAYLACQQLIPQIRLNIKIVLSLVGLIVILVFGSSILKTVESNEQAYIEERFEADYILSNTNADMTIHSNILVELQQTPVYQIQAVESYGSRVGMTIDGEMFDLFAKDLSTFGVEGTLDNKIVITERFADTETLAVGDKIYPYFSSFTSNSTEQYALFEVAAILKTEEPYIGAYIDWTSSFAKDYIPIREVKLNTTDLEELQQYVSRHPAFHLLEKQEMIEQASTMFYQRWSLFIGIFTVLLVATAIGIIQTLWHLVFTNRSQYTIQRLVGLSPNGLIKYLCMQVLTFTLYGLFTGFLVGTLLTRLVLLVDKEANITFDFMTIGFVSGGLLILLIITFGIHGFVMSRRKLSDEMLQL